MKVLLDTGPLVALLNRRDHSHRWSVARTAHLPRPFYLCEAVLTEAFFLLRGIPDGMERLTRQLALREWFDFSFSFADHQDRVGELMLKYRNVPMSFADACLVRMTEVVKDAHILTLDRDFYIYRKQRNQELRVISPPVSGGSV
ncbi:MAG: type II toxin-antitoxin system VapC family toxin [Rhodothermales bacterium]